MKRAIPDSNLPASKRPKLDDDDPFTPNLECSVATLCNLDPPRTCFIRAKAFMVWPMVHDQLRVQVRAPLEGRLISFEISFSGKCAQFFGRDHLHFDSTDEFLISFRGTQVLKKKPSGAPSACPISLKYNEGAVIKYLTTVRWGTEQRIVDTWKLKAEQVDWFRTPPHSRSPTREPASPHATQENHIPDRGRPPTPRLPSTNRSDAIMGISPTRSRSPSAQAHLLARRSHSKSLLNGQPTATDPKIAKSRHLQMSKREKKLLKAFQREARLKSTEDVSALSKTEVDASREPHVPQDAAVTQTAPSEDDLVKLPTMKVGLRTEASIVYSPLAELKQVSASYNVIGVVVSQARPDRTRKNDWTCTLSLVDPTCYCVNPADHFPEEGFKVTCFTSKYKEWLPVAAERGDVLILYQLKAAEFQGSIRGTGYNNRLKWAIYSPSSDVVHHGHFNEELIPRAEGLDGGYGHFFSPFHVVTSSEVAYSRRLSLWWNAVVKEREAALGSVTHIDCSGEDVSSQITERRASRKHRTVSEADPNAPPSGYFDGTVEVLYGAMNEIPGNVYSLYVTDYTANPALYPVQADWAPPGLTDSIMKVEMWDAASDMGPTIEAGKYYSMKNLRARLSPSGYLEAKVVETKIVPLEAGSDDIHLKALLKRKQAWQQSCEMVDGKYIFPHLLLRDIQGDQRFTATVEILHVDPTEGSYSFIYVTDYTSNAILHDASHSGDSWRKGDEDSILKIQLSDGQAVTGRRLEPGFFCHLRNLKTKRNMNGGVRGYLGGDQRLIMKLQTEDPKDVHLNELLERKRMWIDNIASKTSQTNTASKTNQTNTPTPLTPQISEGKRRTHISIQDARRDDVKDFSALARAIDFWPSNLTDFVVIYCSNCNSAVPKTQKACFVCEDSDHEYVQYHYRFFIRLQDEYGDSMEVAVTHKCTLLAGARLADLHEDIDALRDLESRLRPYIGNLREVHDSWSSGTRKPIQTPYFYWSISAKNVPFKDRSVPVYYVKDVVRI